MAPNLIKEPSGLVNALQFHESGLNISSLYESKSFLSQIHSVTAFLLFWTNCRALVDLVRMHENLISYRVVGKTSNTPIYLIFLHIWIVVALLTRF